MIKQLPCSNQQMNSLKNLITDHCNKQRTLQKSERASVSGQLPQIDPGTGAVPPPTAVFPLVPFMYRGDLIEKAKDLAIDVEKVELSINHKQAASNLAIVDEKRRLCLWAILNYPTICKYFTNLIMMTPKIMKKGLTLDAVKPFLLSCVKGKKVIGTELQNKMLFYIRMKRFIAVHPDCDRYLCPILEVERKNSSSNKKHCSGNWERCKCGHEKSKKAPQHKFDNFGNYNKFSKTIFDMNDWNFGGSTQSATVDDEDKE